MSAAFKIPKWEDEGPPVLHGSRLFEASNPKRSLAHLWFTKDRWHLQFEANAVHGCRPVRSFAKMDEAMRVAERATLGGPMAKAHAQRELGI